MRTLKGTVVALFLTETTTKRYLSQTKLTIAPQGIFGDKHFGQIQERSILLASTSSYRLIEDTIGVAMPHGYLGENILIDTKDDLYRLPIGTAIVIGNTVLEITQNCSLCNHLAALDRRIPKLLKDDRGIFAKTIRSSRIALGDHVCIDGRV